AQPAESAEASQPVGQVAEPEETQPAPLPVVEHNYVSPIGWYYCLDQANAEFLDIEKDWVVVFLGHNDEEGYDEYGLFDNMYVNETNFEEFIANGYPPVVTYRAWFEKPDRTGKVTKVNIRIPDKNINKVDEYQAEKIQKYQYLLLQYLFQDLSEEQVNGIIKTLNLTTEEQFDAYRGGADASGFQGGQVEAYPDNTDSAPFVIRSAYSAEYNTIVVTVE
ncbi:MAG: hypothetical protein IKN28_04825, partial [Firmicutes bacterium]|nr:hypothetical protein [Bacillota bacterium]